MNEADEEHHVAKVLIAELDTIDAKNDHRDAKFTVLAESVRHHIREEETRDAAKGQGTRYRFRGSWASGCLPARKSLLKDGIPDRRRTRDGGKVPRPCGFACGCRRAQKSTTRKAPARGSSSRGGKRKSHGRRGETMATKNIIKLRPGKRKVHKVMKEHKEGTLKSGSGKKVKSRKQAVAIALSEARKSGAKIPKKKKKS